jgi:hypothetical protein
VRRLVDQLRREDLVALSAGPAEALRAVARAEATPRPPGGPLPALSFEKHTDMQELVRLDPVHEVGEAGWPYRKDAPDLTS